MKSITIRIDDDTYRGARVLAAQRGSSLTAMVREHLLQLVSEECDRDRLRIAALEELYRIAQQRQEPRNNAPQTARAPRNLW